MSRVVCETGLVGADDAEAMDPRSLEAPAEPAGGGAQGDEEAATQRPMTSYKRSKFIPHNRTEIWYNIGVPEKGPPCGLA